MQQDEGRIDRIIAEALQLTTPEVLIQRIREQSQSNGRALTVIVDNTMHNIPDDVLDGEVYIFNSGSLPTVDNDTLSKAIIKKLMDLDAKLLEAPWERISIVFSGHALLAAQIKMLVYRRLHINTRDIGYFGGHGYRYVELDFRGDLSIQR
jgi:hypothetical protein